MKRKGESGRETFKFQKSNDKGWAARVPKTPGTTRTVSIYQNDTYPVDMFSTLNSTDYDDLIKKETERVFQELGRTNNYIEDDFNWEVKDHHVGEDSQIFYLIKNSSSGEEKFIKREDALKETLSCWQVWCYEVFKSAPIQEVERDMKKATFSFNRDPNPSLDVRLVWDIDTITASIKGEQGEEDVTGILDTGATLSHFDAKILRRTMPTPFSKCSVNRTDRRQSYVASISLADQENEVVVVESPNPSYPMLIGRNIFNQYLHSVDPKKGEHEWICYINAPSHDDFEGEYLVNKDEGEQQDVSEVGGSGDTVVPGAARDLFSKSKPTSDLAPDSSDDGVAPMGGFLSALSMGWCAGAKFSGFTSPTFPFSEEQQDVSVDSGSNDVIVENEGSGSNSGGEIKRDETSEKNYD